MSLRVRVFWAIADVVVGLGVGGLMVTAAARQAFRSRKITASGDGVSSVSLRAGRTPSPEPVIWN